MRANKYFQKNIKDSKFLIDKNIYMYLFNLIKSIFIKPENIERNKKIQNYLKRNTDFINKNIIKDTNKYINTEYSKENFQNILNFIKGQNKVFAGEIIEGILIVIFSFTFNLEKDSNFGKYLYNNISKLKDPQNMILADWIDSNKFRSENIELQDIKKLLALDVSESDRIDNFISEFQNNSPLFNLLYEINKTKYLFIYNEKKNSKTIEYIHRGDFKSQKYLSKIFNLSKENTTVMSSRDTISNSMNMLISCFFYSGEFGKVKKTPIRIIRSFLISVYIYYQNYHSTLMNFIKPSDNKNNEKKDELAVIPFCLDLQGAFIEGKFAHIIFAPIRVEPRISKIILTQNNFRENGLYEMSKILLFNKNIKSIEYKVTLLKTYFLDYLNFGLGIFDNYDIEELNLSYNYIREDGEEYLSKILSHLKGLKTIILNSNDLKGGIASFFVVLKKLYREKKSKLENIILSKCSLDDSSLYELGELLKCKFCKLKKVILSMNNNPNNIKFLKKFNKNKSLIEFNYSKTLIGNQEIDDIKKIINNTNIRHLNISKNRISNFNEFIRIIYRTKLINEKNENKNIIIDYKGLLMDLDLSSSDIWNKNKSHINLLSKILLDTNLRCLDICHILLGPNPDKYKNISKNETYYETIMKLKNHLEKDKVKFKRLHKSKVSIISDINHLQNIEIFKDFDEELNDLIINNIIKDKDCIFPVYLKENSKKLLNMMIENEKYKDILEKENITEPENKKIFLDKILNYITLKRKELELDVVNKELENEKLLII